MSTVERIAKRAEQLPRELQEELVDYTEYLFDKYEKQKVREKEWSKASMRSAIRGFENDPITYSIDDIPKNAA